MVEKSSNSVLVGDSESKAASSEGKDEPTESKIPDVSSISAFMKQVSELVKWVKDLNFVISKCAYVTGCFVLGNAISLFELM